MHPILFQLGPITLRSYGAMMAVAFLAGFWTASRRCLRDNLNPERILDLMPWLIIGSLLGARVVYVTTYWHEEFADRPWTEIFMIQHGGVVYYGGLIGAALAGTIYIRWKSLPFWKVADTLAPSIALGYVFGRIGCLLNGCCYGKVCSLPWAIRFPNGSFAWDKQSSDHLVGPLDPSLPVHPTQVYDALLNLCLYLGLAWLYRRKKFDGQVFATYLLCYAVTRSVVESFRGDYSSLHIHFGLTPAQAVGIAIFAAGAALYALCWRMAPKKL